MVLRYMHRPGFRGIWFPGSRFQVSSCGFRVSGFGYVNEKKTFCRGFHGSPDPPNSVFGFRVSGGGSGFGFRVSGAEVDDLLLPLYYSQA